jgi:hypothetical protein
MRKSSFLILGLLFSLSVFSQKTPHGSKLQIDCAVCHTTGNWKVNSLTSTFDHSKTAFDLQGQHQQIDCKMCHLSLSFLDEKGQNECASCHLDVHQNTLGNNCAMCHTSKSWVIEDVNEIHFNSRFPLIGAHANADCFDCHLSDNLLQFRPLGVECFDCHKAEYLATTTPNHQSAGYSTECFDCHNMRTSGWASGGFEHGFFPLTEGHAIVDCTLCHVPGSIQKPSPECESCHLADYNASLNPPHLQLNFSINCLECHTIKPDWKPARFDIHNDFYVLEGAHAAIASECASCHAAGYVNTPNTCFGCHADDYNQTTDPNHLAANFAIDCTSCHTQNAWKPSTFDHDASYFPIYSGTHKGEWNNCSDCHTVSNNYALFSCIDCHEHNKTDTDNQHRDENGYVYNSVNCLTCHPTGKAD